MTAVREMLAERLEIGCRRVRLADVKRHPNDPGRSGQRRTDRFRRQTENVRVHEFHGMASPPEHRSHRKDSHRRINGQSGRNIHECHGNHGNLQGET